MFKVSTEISVFRNSFENSGILMNYFLENPSEFSFKKMKEISDLIEFDNEVMNDQKN